MGGANVIYVFTFVKTSEKITMLEYIAILGFTMVGYLFPEWLLIITKAESIGVPVSQNVLAATAAFCLSTYYVLGA